MMREDFDLAVFKATLEYVIPEDETMYTEEYFSGRVLTKDPDTNAKTYAMGHPDT